MEYEIQLQGSKNKRFKSLSTTAIMRLFRRDGRMELRIMRSFRRAAAKPIRNVNRRQQQQRTPQNKKERLNLAFSKRPKDQNPVV